MFEFISEEQQYNIMFTTLPKKKTPTVISVCSNGLCWVKLNLRPSYFEIWWPKKASSSVKYGAWILTAYLSPPFISPQSSPFSKDLRKSLETAFSLYGLGSVLRNKIHSFLKSRSLEEKSLELMQLAWSFFFKFVSHKIDHEISRTLHH